MFDVPYPSRTVVIDSPPSVAEVTQRLGSEVAAPESRLQLRERRTQLFEGTFAGGEFRFALIFGLVLAIAGGTIAFVGAAAAGRVQPSERTVA